MGIQRGTAQVIAVAGVFLDGEVLAKRSRVVTSHFSSEMGYHCSTALGPVMVVFDPPPTWQRAVTPKPVSPSRYPRWSDFLTRRIDSLRFMLRHRRICIKWM